MVSVWDVYSRVFIKKFPYLRPSQIEILTKFENVRDEHKIIEIEAPPGTGKSLINMIIALSLDTDWNDVFNKIVIATCTKRLQYQYVESFGDLLKQCGISYAIGLGLSTFSCPVTKKREDVCLATLGYACKYLPKILEDSYSELKKSKDDLIFFGFYLPFAEVDPDTIVKAIPKDSVCCEYWENEKKVFRSKVIFANYHYLVTHTLFRDTLPAPSVLILDEGHKFPDVISDLGSIYLSERCIEMLKEFNIIEKLNDICSYNDPYNTYSDFIEYFLSCEELLLKEYALKGFERLIILELLSRTKMHKIIKDYAIMNGESLSKYFAIEVYNDGIRVVPTYYAHYAILYHYSLYTKTNVIISSATLPPKGKTYGTIRLYSDIDAYDPKNRPVVYLIDAPEMSDKKLLMPSVKKFIIDLVNLLWSCPYFRRIVIHTINNYARDVVGALLEDAGYPVIITKDLHKDIDNWLKMKEGIIVSAGMEEGVDLKYDTAYVQIILKIPKYDFRKDLFIRHLNNSDKELYHYYIAKRIVQMAGRVCRAEDDFGLTIVVDRRAYSHYTKYKHLYPKYYRDACRLMTIKQFVYHFPDYVARVSKLIAKRLAKKEYKNILEDMVEQLLKDLSKV